MSNNCDCDENSPCRITGNCTCSSTPQIILSTRRAILSFLRLVNSSDLSFEEIISKYKIIKPKVTLSRRDKLLRIKKLDFFVKIRRVQKKYFETK